MCAARAFNANYRLTLAGNDRERYLNKIALCGDTDPYEILEKDYSFDGDKLPCIAREDLVQYLVLTTEFYTLQQLKGHEALEAHNYFTSGWVKLVGSKEVAGGLVVVIGKVNHSQKMSEPPLRTWLLIRQCGEVLTAHCECMAGLGSVCSHVGAVLFFLEVLTIKKKNLPSTSKDNAWLPPSCSEVPISEVRQCDFTSADRKYKLAKGECEDREPKKVVCVQKDWKASDSEISEFFKTKEKDYPDCAVFSVFPDHHKRFVPVQVPSSLPPPLSSLFNVELSVLSYKDLLEECEKLFNTIAISEKQAERLEELTYEQWKCALFVLHHAGRISASVMRKACHSDSDPDNPSVSLIKTICYPLKHSIDTPATAYGKDMEKHHLKSTVS